MNREPVTREAIIAGAIALIAQGLVVWQAPLTGEQIAWVNSILTLAALAWTVLRARPQVTPLSDPRDQQGRPLTPEEAP